MFLPKIVLLAVTASLVSAAPVFAQQGRDADKRDALTLQFENDRFANTDQHYTHGMRLNYSPKPEAVPGWAENLASQLTRLTSSFFRPERSRIGFVLGQSIFTPDDLTRRDLVIDDRPYAGWLYTGLSLHSESDLHLDSVELTVGMVGPSAGAEFVQRSFHEVISATDPKGWDNQLEDEPTIMLTAERKIRVARLDDEIFGLSFDALPHYGFSLGNVYTHAQGGILFRVGHNMPYDFGPPQIRPSLGGSDPYIPTGRFGWYLFAGGTGRAVLRDIFLDGNTFADSHSVDKKHLVGDFRMGIAFALPSVRIAYTTVFRTREYEEQMSPDRFGGISATVRF